MRAGDFGLACGSLPPGPRNSLADVPGVTVGHTTRAPFLRYCGEEAALDVKAARAGSVSVGELIRRAVEAYDEDAETEAAELRALLSVLATTHDETLHRLDHTERKLDETLAYPAGTRR